MLSFEQYQEIGKQVRAEEAKIKAMQAKVREEELRKRGVNPNQQITEKPKYDHPCMPEDGFITVLYILAMIASLIFKQFWIAWIGLTIAYVKFITRHDND